MLGAGVRLCQESRLIGWSEIPFARYPLCLQRRQVAFLFVGRHGGPPGNCTSSTISYERFHYRAESLAAFPPLQALRRRLTASHSIDGLYRLTNVGCSGSVPNDPRTANFRLHMSSRNLNQLEASRARYQSDFEFAVDSGPSEA